MFLQKLAFIGQSSCDPKQITLLKKVLKMSHLIFDHLANDLPGNSVWPKQHYKMRLLKPFQTTVEMSFQECTLTVHIRENQDNH